MTNRDTVSPKDALNLLMEGNKRFINNTPRQYDTIKIRQETKNHLTKRKPFIFKSNWYLV